DGVLAYRELLAAVLVRRGRRLGVSITHIWVDSEPSRAGARAMWSIPKEIAKFRFTGGSVFDGSVFDGSAATAEGRIADATFAARGPITVRPPFPLRGTTFQALDGRGVQTPIIARGGVRLARATWTVDPEGPLAWLRGTPLVSVAARDFRMRFGPRR
ncbi:MAG TPA: acetoacetate decarboxylase family protein, partial [Pseudonocardiaceae bacterium]|nr:acetoacetate decarboxylase family protein [Pseudonocardiaceae bacterium]